MLSKRTVIGTVVGCVITAIGVIALVGSFGLQTTNLNDTYGIGESTAYQFDSPKGAKQFMEISGETFDVKIVTPGTGLQVPNTPHKNKVNFDWVILEPGISRIEIQNTGQKELLVTGTIEHNSDPIFFTYHILTIISGIVIVGFSAGFSIRKPKGF